MNPTSSSRKDEIIRLIKKGESHFYIENKLGVSNEIIRGTCKDAGVKCRPSSNKSRSGWDVKLADLWARKSLGSAVYDRGSKLSNASFFKWRSNFIHHNLTLQNFEL